MKKVFWIGIVLLIVAAIGVYVYTFKKPARTAASEEALYTISANELVSQFENDENAANAKYLNQVIKVYGTVVSVSESANNFTVLLKEINSNVGVSCSFEKTNFEKSKVPRGQKVYIKGICSGFLFDVILNKCALDTVASL
jgi:hypothetical protein